MPNDATSTTKFRDDSIPLTNATNSTHCEGFCGIEAPGGVRLLYWAPDEATNGSVGANQSTLVSDGFTFTSPSVYVIYTSLRATRTCGTGTALSLQTIGPSFSEKTIGYSNRFLAYGTMTGHQEHCKWQNVRMGNFSTIDFTSLYYHPISTSTTTIAGCPPYINPRISLPAELTNVDRSWKTCEPLFFGAFDPPRVMNKGYGLAPTKLAPGKLPPPTPKAGSVADAGLPKPTGDPSNPDVKSPSDDPPMIGGWPFHMVDTTHTEPSKMAQPKEHNEPPKGNNDNQSLPPVLATSNNPKLTTNADDELPTKAPTEQSPVPVFDPQLQSEKKHPEKISSKVPKQNGRMPASNVADDNKTPQQAGPTQSKPEVFPKDPVEASDDQVQNKSPKVLPIGSKHDDSENVKTAEPGTDAHHKPLRPSTSQDEKNPTDYQYNDVRASSPPDTKDFKEQQASKSKLVDGPNLSNTGELPSESGQDGDIIESSLSKDITNEGDEVVAGPNGAGRQSDAQSSHLAQLQVAGRSVVNLPNHMLRVGSQTLTPGQQATISSVVVSAGSTAVALDGSTYAFSSSQTVTPTKPEPDAFSLPKDDQPFTIPVPTGATPDIAGLSAALPGATVVLAPGGSVVEVQGFHRPTNMHVATASGATKQSEPVFDTANDAEIKSKIFAALSTSSIPPSSASPGAASGNGEEESPVMIWVPGPADATSNSITLANNSTHSSLSMPQVTASASAGSKKITTTKSGGNSTDSADGGLRVDGAAQSPGMPPVDGGKKKNAAPLLAAHFPSGGRVSWLWSWGVIFAIGEALDLGG